MARDTLPTVLFLHPSDEMYGADRQLLALVRASRQQCRPVVLLPDDLAYAGPLSAALRREGIIVEVGALPVLRRRYGSPRAILGWLPRAARGWLWVLRRAKAHGSRAVVSNSSAVPIGPSVSLLLRVPHIWFVRELVESPSWYRHMIRVAAGLAHGSVVAISGAVARWLGPMGSRGPIVLYDAVDIDDTPRPLGPSPTAVFVGRLNEWKGWEVFVRAAGIARSRVDGSRYVLAGGTVSGGVVTDSTVERAIQDADASGEWLTWLGAVSDVTEVMGSAWVVVAPSTRPEPLGNVVLEAMTLGRATIASEIGGLPEMTVESETGLLVPPGDVNELADAMVEVLSDKAMAERLGAAGRDRVEAEFSVDHFNSAWADLLARALASPGS